MGRRRPDLEDVELKVQIGVEGLREAQRDLRRLGPDAARELRYELEGAVESTILPDIKRKVRADIAGPKKKPPRSTGRMLSTIAAQASGRAVFIVAGSSRVNYYGWRDFGGTLRPSGKRRNTQNRPFLSRGRYIYPSVDENDRALGQAAEKAVTTSVRRLNLD